MPALRAQAERLPVERLRGKHWGRARPGWAKEWS